MNPNKFIIKIFLLLSVKLGFACSCADFPDTFIEHVRADHIIFSAEVIDGVELPNNAYSHFGYDSFTKLKVNNWYQNQMQSDTVYFANGICCLCIGSLKSTEKGSQFVLKTSKFLVSDWLGYLDNRDTSLVRFLEDYKEYPIVDNSTCDISSLRIVDDQVNGNITKNFYQSRKFIAKLIGLFSNKKAEEYRLETQKVSLPRFAKIMKRRRNGIFHN